MEQAQLTPVLQAAVNDSAMTLKEAWQFQEFLEEQVGNCLLPPHLEIVSLKLQLYLSDPQGQTLH